MSTDLREELDALARTQSFSPDPSAWDRGRRARRRDRGLAAVAALVVVAGLGGAALWSTSDREARTASTDVVEGGAIPSRIEDVPADLGLTEDLAVGRASAAFVSGAGEPVVVTAVDGVPHKLALPAFGPDKAAFALSPDGRTLAFQQMWDDGTRVVLVDLESGDSTPLLLQAGDRLEIDGLQWSPGGTWLGWVAPRMGQVPAVAGQVRVSGGEARRLVPAASMSSIAVADDGDAVLGRVSGGLVAWPKDGATEPVPTDAGLAAGAFSPDGTRVALASAPGKASWTLDTSTGEVRAHPFPDDTLGEAVVRPLGWLDDRLQLLLVQELDGDGGELVVTTPAVGTTSTWRRSVGSVDRSIANSLSLAVDLVPDLDGTSNQQLTHDFGRPSADDGPGWLPYGLGALLVLLVGLALAGLRRHRA